MRAERSSWGKLAPTRKWWTATVVAGGTLGTAWAEAGDWNQTLTIAAIGLAVQRFTAWLIPNDDAPDRDAVKSRIKERSQ